MDPDTLRPSEEKEDPGTRLERARKLKEEGAWALISRPLESFRLAFLVIVKAFHGEHIYVEESLSNMPCMPQ